MTFAFILGFDLVPILTCTDGHADLDFSTYMSMLISRIAIGYKVESESQFEGLVVCALLQNFESGRLTFYPRLHFSVDNSIEFCTVCLGLFLPRKWPLFY